LISSYTDREEQPSVNAVAFSPLRLRAVIAAIGDLAGRRAALPACFLAAAGHHRRPSRDWPASRVTGQLRRGNRPKRRVQEESKHSQNGKPGSESIIFLRRRPGTCISRQKPEMKPVQETATCPSRAWACSRVMPLVPASGGIRDHRRSPGLARQDIRSGNRAGISGQVTNSTPAVIRLACLRQIGTSRGGWLTTEGFAGCSDNRSCFPAAGCPGSGGRRHA
jgi:hypothetical protein